MKRNIAIFLALNFTVIAFADERESEKSQAALFASSEICQLLSMLVDDSKIAGAQVAVGSVDAPMLLKSVGRQSVDRGEPIDDDTRFCIGSCSKMFAAAVVLALESQGKLKLDVPIDEWLDEFSSLEIEGNGEATRAPTLHELLCHRSGVYTQRNRMTMTQTRWIRDFKLSLSASVAGIGSELLIAEPGNRFAYSGAGYCVLGRVAEVAGERAFDQLLSAHICRPLGLTATSYFVPAGVDNVAVGHRIVNGKLVVSKSSPHLLGTRHKLVLVGGSIYCSAREAARFAQMMIGQGTLGERAVLTRAQWQLMTTPQTPDDQGGYGFGIRVAIDKMTGKKTVLSHGGALSGYFSYMLMDLQTKRFGVVHYTGGRQTAQVLKALQSWVSSPR
jgi:CubicO group peptidase (beta-lactamase class C family)